MTNQNSYANLYNASIIFLKNIKNRLRYSIADNGLKIINNKFKGTYIKMKVLKPIKVVLNWIEKILNLLAAGYK